ncbi:urease accessory protein UreF [Nocardioides solisilvae]|uniref:urease accessory protein UreF n=1 Tax=Nocardioides solisilvae TaxID=1542435 RepID=UPI000D744C60|nr:urease accessory UreF family protein [Nocardioides solisilvae]
METPTGPVPSRRAAPAVPVAGASSHALALLLADARLPVGGHTQSGGLEPALQRGLSPDGLPGYCRTRLATVARTEAATAVVTAYAARHGGDLDLVHAHWAARTPSDAQRSTAYELGRALLRLGRRVWPEDPLLAGWSLPTARPLVLGAVAAAAGLAAADLARVTGYDDVQTVLAAGLKLAPADPLQAVVWTRQLLPAVDALVDAVHGLTDPADIPSGSAPQIEEWAQAHARTTRRLFRA